MRKVILLVTLLVVQTLVLAGDVALEKTEYAGWKNCVRLSNGEIELVVTTDVGPRVIRLGFVGGQNLFKEFKARPAAIRGRRTADTVSGMLPRWPPERMRWTTRR